jgi:hypothetical protein
MLMDQLSVFSENRAGTLVEITSLLADSGIDIEALTIAETSEYGVLRFLVDAPKKALEALRLGGFVASLTPVIALKMRNKPGALNDIAKTLADAGISIEYLYACVAREEGSAFVILRVEETDAAVALLAAEGYEPFRP